MNARQPLGSTSLIRGFDELSLNDLSSVGGKNASLGELRQELSPKGIRVPNGFATTAAAYRRFLDENNLEERLRRILDSLDGTDVAQLQAAGHAARSAILAAKLPQDIETAILEAYYRLSNGRGPIDVAVRSSATAEDLPEASFAGQQETYLNVKGDTQLLDSCRRCFASLFTDRAISYRMHHGFNHLDVALSIGVQQMVRSDLATAGVMFTLDTETGFRNAVLINAAYGLGESVVQGSVNPDEYHVFKPTLAEPGKRPILSKQVGTKEHRLVYDEGGERQTRLESVPLEDRRVFALDDDAILELARWAVLIEEHYSEKSGRWTPMDIEWARDGRTQELFIVQARPETVQSRRDSLKLERYELATKGEVIVTGRAVGAMIGQGPTRIIEDVSRLDELQPGEVLVADRTDPDWEPVMARAAAVVTNRGGRTCHAAIVSRELGLPAIVGATGATEAITTGQDVTVSCAEGDTGRVYSGLLPITKHAHDVKEMPRPKTKIMMNLANPGEAFALSFIPNDGVGLARLEFIISNRLRIHPIALCEYPNIADRAARQRIAEITTGYADKQQYFVEKVTEGVAMIAAAFWPKDVIVRLSDFKTNEYANLIGGRDYEPQEENPMLGFRGAARYVHPQFERAFALECQAMHRVRDEMGLTNVKLMVPFCRTVEEGQQVLKALARHGLVRGEDNLEIYVMCEVPSNVVSAKEFAQIFDGFSIGSNDLTQLVLGVDRDSEIVADTFDERNPAVLQMIAQVIDKAHQAGRPIGICGQAPSDYPEFARFVVEQGIDSISLSPDAVITTTLDILELERELGEEASTKPETPATAQC